MKTQTAAGLWCAFLGGFGAHRFYLGKIVTGIVYLLFFWTSIPGFVASIELLVIAFSDTRKWANKYNGGRPTPPAHWAVKGLALLVPIVFVAGVLAAVALPAYHDYTERARSAQMRQLSAQLQPLAMTLGEPSHLALQQAAVADEVRQVVVAQPGSPWSTQHP